MNEISESRLVGAELLDSAVAQAEHKTLLVARDQRRTRNVGPARFGVARIVGEEICDLPIGVARADDHRNAVDNFGEPMRNHAARHQIRGDAFGPRGGGPYTRRIDDMGEKQQQYGAAHGIGEHRAHQRRHQRADMDDLQLRAILERTQRPAEPDGEADIEEHDAERGHAQRRLAEQGEQALAAGRHQVEQPETLNQEQEKSRDGK